MSDLALPRNVASLPSVQKVLGKLDRTRRTATELRKEAEHAVNPMVATLSTQGGAAVNGLLQVYGGKHAMTGLMVAGLGGIVIGTVYSKPEAVLFGNGVLAPLVSAQVVSMLVSRGVPAAS